MAQINTNEIYIKLASVRSVLNCYVPRTAEAKKHLDRGVNFRYFLIKDSIQLLHEGIEKLQSNDSQIARINIAFNSIYINLRGIIDNLAWMLRYEIISDVVSPKSISFTNNKFLTKLSSANYKIDWISEYSNWFYDLSLLRDPIAHRLPLYIPPGCVIDPDSIEAVVELNAKKYETIEEFREIQYEISKYRKFEAVFIVDDAEKGISYPMSINGALQNDLDYLCKFSIHAINELCNAIKSKKKYN